MMKANRRIFKSFQRRNNKNDDYMEEFDAYIKVIKSYRGRTPIHLGLIRSKIINMEVQDTNNPIP